MSQSLTCPKCGAPRQPQELYCAFCGLIFGREGGERRERRPARSAPPAPAVAAAEINPYAPPVADVDAGFRHAGPTEGVWRNGNLLIMRRNASLPERCVKCNRPATHSRLQKLSWHPAGWYLLILIS